MTTTISELREKLKSAKVMTTNVSINGDTFEVRGLLRSPLNKVFAQCRNKNTGKSDNDKLEGALLAACVCDPETHEPIFTDANDWNLPRHIVGPLLSAVFKVNGMDKEDVDPKDSESIAG